MGAVSKLLQRGAYYVARERDLTKTLANATMVEGELHKFPKAGEIVLVMGKPVVRTGRVIPWDPAEATEVALNQLRIAAAQNVYEEVYATVSRTERPKTVVVLQDKTIRSPEPSGLYVYRRPGQRIQRKRKTYERWSDT